MSDRFLPVATPSIGPLEKAYVAAAVESGWVSSAGPYIRKFEQAFASYTDCSHAIATCNGTAALHLILAALRIGPGDEVIVPSLTFIATAHAVLQTGATPVFADVDAETWCIDPAAVERAMTPSTRAIIAVHLYGHPADMEALGSIARRRGVVVIEDAAEGLGAAIGGRPAGSLATAAAFSFYGNKTITTGEGGMVTTNDARLAERIEFLKDHGMHKTRRYFHTELAFNYRMTNLQAALGCAQMERIGELVEQRRRVFHWYSAKLRSVGGIRLNYERPGFRSGYWLPCVVLDNHSEADRAAVQQELTRQEIDTRPFFVPMHLLPHLQRYKAVSRDGAGCPQAAYLAERGFNIPSGVHIGPEECDRVSAELKAILRRMPVRVPHRVSAYGAPVNW